MFWSARSRTTGVAAGAVALALLLGACGSDSKSSSTTAAASSAAPATTAASATSAASTAPASSAAPTTAAPTTTAADPLGTPNAAKGDPILIGTINEAGSGSLDTQSANTLKGLKIAASYANDYLGGIAGHPIQIVDCGNKATPAGATDCANQMVEKKINLYTHPYSGEEGPIVKVLTAAGIPMVLGSSSSNEGLTTPGVLALTGGYPATLGAFAIDAQQRGVKKFVMVTIDVPAATGAAKALGNIVFKKEGVGFDVVAVPPGTADMSPQLQSAVSGGADAVAVTGDASFCTSFLQAYKTLGLDVKRYVIATCLDPKVIDAVGDTLAGSLATTGRAAGPDDALFAATVKKYGDSSINPDPAIAGGVADGWGDLMSILNGLKGYTGGIDNASLAAAFKAAKGVSIALSGGLTYTCDGTAIPLIKNVCSGQVQLGTVDAKGAVGGLTKIDSAPAFAS